ncbi:MAG: hypothetical protein HC866_10815 [Leptolyngbyaceae cyanobacterium RU_5_1]|nr:hypothetical protein [Leptolyngbyaceae cyanobacterium RU_5_1]
MSEIARRLTVAELSQRILEMAKTGVYRASVFEAFQPVATKKQISQAIRHAKQFGLHSVAKLRDVELGTYYQVDAVKCQSLQQIVRTTVPLESPEDLLKRTTTALLTIQRMLAVAGGGAIALFGIGLFCLITSKPQLGLGLLTSAASAIGVWVLQKAVAKRAL